MFCRVQWHSLPDHPSWAFEMYPLCTPFSCLCLDCYWLINRRYLPPRLISCKDWLWPMTHDLQPLWRFSYTSSPPYRTGFTSAGLWCPLSVPFECVTWWRWLGGDASKWSGAVHWLCRGLPGGAGQGQLPAMFSLGPPGMSYKVICMWLLLCWAWRSSGEAKLCTKASCC